MTTVGLPTGGPLGHPRAPMRWLIPSFVGGTLRRRIAICSGVFVALASIHGQTVEIGRAQSQRTIENRDQLGTIAVVDSKDILSLQTDLVVANTELLAQNEP